VKFDVVDLSGEESGAIEQRLAELRQWWMELAESDFQRTAPKSVAYGSSGQDMIAIGRYMAEMGQMVVPGDLTPEQFYGMLGCAFYLQGKLARIGEAFRTGQKPNEDHMFDATIYALMFRRIEQVGHWG
jgi:hypothetical protein